MLRQLGHGLGAHPPLAWPRERQDEDPCGRGDRMHVGSLVDLDIIGVNAV